MAKKIPVQEVKLCLRGFDNKLLDKSVKDLMDMLRRTGARVRGPIPLPTRKRRFDILISPHVNKHARDQYEIRVHKRLLFVESVGQAMDELQNMNLPAGIDFRVSATTIGGNPS